MKNITIKTIRDKQKQTEKLAEKFFLRPREENSSIDKFGKKHGKIRQALNSIFVILFVLFVGGVGGILLDRFGIPYLIAKYPQLNKYEILKKISEPTVIVRVTEDVKISEDRAVVDTVKKASSSMVFIRDVADEKDEEIEFKKAGIIIMSDGYILTFADGSQKKETAETDGENSKEDSLASLAEDKKKTQVKLSNGKMYEAEKIKEDKESGLAIFRIKEKNLPVLAFLDSRSIEVGEKLVIINESVAVDVVSKFVDVSKTGEMENNSSSVDKKIIATSRSLDDSYKGALVLNLRGEIAGIMIDGNVFLAANEIKEFINSAIK